MSVLRGFCWPRRHAGCAAAARAGSRQDRHGALDVERRRADRDREGLLQGSRHQARIEDIDTSANAIALLAQNQFQIVAGGISAGYFNALEKGLPITIVADRVSTPIGHNLMLRPDLKDR